MKIDLKFWLILFNSILTINGTGYDGSQYILELIRFQFEDLTQFLLWYSIFLYIDEN